MHARGTNTALLLRNKHLWLKYV